MVEVLPILLLYLTKFAVKKFQNPPLTSTAHKFGQLAKCLNYHEARMVGEGCYMIGGLLPPIKFSEYFLEKNLTTTNNRV